MQDARARERVAGANDAPPPRIDGIAAPGFTDEGGGRPVKATDVSKMGWIGPWQQATGRSARHLLRKRLEADEVGFARSVAEQLLCGGRAHVGGQEATVGDAAAEYRVTLRIKGFRRKSDGQRHRIRACFRE